MCRSTCVWHMLTQCVLLCLTCDVRCPTRAHRVSITCLSLIVLYLCACKSQTANLPCDGKGERVIFYDWFVLLFLLCANLVLYTRSERLHIVQDWGSHATTHDGMAYVPYHHQACFACWATLLRSYVLCWLCPQPTPDGATFPFHSIPPAFFPPLASYLPPPGS